MTLVDGSHERCCGGNVCGGCALLVLAAMLVIGGVVVPFVLAAQRSTLLITVAIALGAILCAINAVVQVSRVPYGIVNAFLFPIIALGLVMVSSALIAVCGYLLCVY